MSIEYLNQTVWCRLGPSLVHGIGVIAIRDIPKGTRLTDYTIRDYLQGKPPRHFQIEAWQFNFIKSEIKNLILDRMVHTKGNPIIFISPNSDQILRGFMNHAEYPNSDGETALRDIAKGEEVTENYVSIVSGEIHEVSKVKIEKFR